MPREKFHDIEFSLDLDSAPQEILDWSRDHLGEGEDKNIKIYELRELIFERGDIVPHRTDDAYLLKFLRARSFNIESAYKLLVNYYIFKENNPELHENLNPLDLRFIGDADVIQVLPYREQTGRRILIYKLGNWDPAKCPVDDMFKATLTVLEIGSLEPRAQILGGVCIFDFKDISITHAWHITPGVAKKVLELMVTSFPLKVHAVHIVFESRAFDVIYNIFKPLLNNKMKEKWVNTEFDVHPQKMLLAEYRGETSGMSSNNIFFHGSDLESLHNHINPKYLPKRYGGVRPNYRYKRWVESFRNSSIILRELRSLGYVISEEFLQKKFTTEEDEKTDSEDE